MSILINMSRTQSSMSEKIHSEGKLHFQVNKSFSFFYLPKTRVMFAKKMSTVHSIQDGIYFQFNYAEVTSSFALIPLESRCVDDPERLRSSSGKSDILNHVSGLAQTWKSGVSLNFCCRFYSTREGLDHFTKSQLALFTFLSATKFSIQEKNWSICHKMLLFEKIANKNGSGCLVGRFHFRFYYQAGPQLVIHSKCTAIISYVYGKSLPCSSSQ